MTRETLAAFALSFGAGPILYAMLLRAGRPALLPAALGVGVAAALSAWLQAQEAVLGALAALWLGWVLAVALLALALRQRLARASARRWVAVAGVLATTLPWFGLATAQWMAT